MITFNELLDEVNKFINESNCNDIESIIIAGGSILSEIAPNQYINQSLDKCRFGFGNIGDRKYSFYITDELKHDEIKIIPVPKYKPKYIQYRLMED